MGAKLRGQQKDAEACCTAAPAADERCVRLKTRQISR